MKKSKTQKGITLVALIITIIVLLILAIVAIGAVQNDGIIQYAKNARTEYKQAQTNEQTLLNSYLEKLDKNDITNANWRQYGTEVTNGTMRLKVGDTVNYVSGKTIDDIYGYGEGATYEEAGGKWKVLGAENGKILLMSTHAVTVGGTTGEGADGGYDENVAVQEINGMCSGFNNEESGADSNTPSRSLKIEDINNITGYNPTQQADIYGKGTVSEYGKKVTYTLGADGQTLTYTVEGKPELTDSYTMTEEEYFAGLEAGESFVVENSYYEYDISKVEILEDIVLPEDSNYTHLASSFSICKDKNDKDDWMNSFVRKGVFCLYNNSSISTMELWGSNYQDGLYTAGNFVAVVTLSSDVVLTESENAEYDWEISVQGE